ncbi:hypothetical protein QBC35DRAFT_529066 [Podospora australis]|uniref:Uncharacterized protein n=1 Tax=Podospora australis TaxID=1536484 RepID=A0AAN7ALR4_9PEZI|nr:hypothetical protein QBC35DRAFT_529066 [Podospora australis]
MRFPTISFRFRFWQPRPGAAPGESKKIWQKKALVLGAPTSAIAITIYHVKNDKFPPPPPPPPTAGAFALTAQEAATRRSDNGSKGGSRPPGVPLIIPPAPPPRPTNLPPPPTWIS